MLEVLKEQLLDSEWVFSQWSPCMDILATLNKNGDVDLWRIASTIQKIFPSIHESESVLDFHFTQDSHYFLYLTDVLFSTSRENGISFI